MAIGTNLHLTFALPTPWMSPGWLAMKWITWIFLFPYGWQVINMVFFLRTLSTYKGGNATIDLQVSLFILSDSVLIFYVRCTSCGLILNALVITEYVEPSHFTIFHDNWFTTYHPSYKILLISVKLNHLAYICSFLHVH